ncbi:SDR family oxidoreductase [uncultured Aliiroseovarius sp.]|uniref:SDR family NAD(P)-dependent oxidoreductase n=1 Tax=uncultured Aliiroseovarius sp. TaxID=1658783 RepID=UPI00260D35F9|nr:SDR family oxidoreductase [uncultured Aliiroseovarius sp.]
MSFSISGKTAIVTGAANGIGLSIARHFADRGANVICADIDEKRLVDEWGPNPDDGVDEPSNTRIFAGDLRQKLTIANLLSATIDSFERVDILVNASRQVLLADPLDVDNGAVQTLLDQNLMTSLRLSQLVARRMIQQGEGLDEEEQTSPLGAIVNLSSVAATRTQPGLMAYSIASAALDQMTRSLAVALASHRIRVNAVAFGSVMSASLRDAIRETGDTRADIIEGTPLGRIASANELAEAVQFLASEGSGFMTGHILTVDGGRSLLDVVGNPCH